MPNRNTDRQDGGRERDAFEGAPIDRRTFLGAAAATGAALSLPGTTPVAGNVSDPRLTDVCQYVVNNTGSDYETPVVVEFDNNATADWFDSQFTYDDKNRGEDPDKTVIRYFPSPAGHGLLTESEVATLLDNEGVTSVDFSPGANPFWKLQGGSVSTVFPDAVNSRGYLSYDEVVAGIDYLDSQYPNRVNDQTIGHSPGWYNSVNEEDTDWDVHVTEVSNDLGNVADKDKVVYSLSIHGDERAGAEAGFRLIEDIAKGNASEFEGLLDDIVLLFVWTNPDGWVAREPWTDTVGFTDRNFRRGNGGSYNGSSLDTNRQYPTIGWTNPAFLPAEPDGAPTFFEDEVPDALAIVDHLRTYENVEYFCDYHGMYTADHMVYNLETNGPLDHAGIHELDALSRRTGTAMLRRWGKVEAMEDDIKEAAAIEYGSTNFVPSGEQFNGLFDWGTVYDTIDYQVTGGMMGWASAPEEFGGLGAVALSPEMIISNNYSFAIKEWKPWWTRHYAEGYRLSMRTFAELAAVDTDATIGTGGRDTAYVTTEELTRSSDDLPHTGDDADPPSGTTTVRSEREVVGPTAGGGPTLSIRSEDTTRSLFVQVDSAGGEAGVRLLGPDGSVHDSIVVGDPQATTGPMPRELYVASPEEGDWTVEVDGDDIDVSISALDSESTYPDPRDAWNGEGFEQTEYEVNPMGFFEDLVSYLEDGTLEGIPQDTIGSDTLEGYDQLVVSHDVGIDDADYVDAIDSFVEGGGDLVVTDTGVHLLGALDAVEGISPDDIEDVTVQFATLSNRDLEHPLLCDVRPRQQELYKGPQIGYTDGYDQPATVVDGGAFDAAGGESAGEMGGFGRVGLGRISLDDARIDCIGSILPPAKQTEILHPFGMADYAVSFMGHTILCNALGFEQRRFVAGGMVGTYGPDWRGVTLPAGDSNRNGEVSIRDSVLIKQHLVGMEPDAFHPSVADTNLDGEVSVRDSVLIKQFLVGMIGKGDLEISNVSATAGNGELTIDTDLENVGGMGAIRQAEFRLAESEDDLDEYAVIALETASLGPEESGTVSATIETTHLTAGTYHYSVSCDGEEKTGTVTL